MVAFGVPLITSFIGLVAYAILNGLVHGGWRDKVIASVIIVFVAFAVFTLELVYRDDAGNHSAPPPDPYRNRKKD